MPSLISGKLALEDHAAVLCAMLNAMPRGRFQVVVAVVLDPCVVVVC